MSRHNYTHLWNDLPDSERERLMPCMIESKIRQIEHSKRKIIKAHRALLKEMNDHIGNLEKELRSRVK